MSGAPGDADLTGLLGSRLCHDLISPIGAVGNGLELVNMSGARGTPEMTLVADSVANAQARIRFYRIAFGASRADQSLGAPELADILQDVYGSGRLQVAWRAAGEVGRDAAKLAFLLVLCIESALSRGGRIGVERDGRSWAVSGTGAKYRDLAPFWPVLEGGPAGEAITPERVHFPLAAAQAMATGTALRVRRGEDGVQIEAAPV